MQDNTHILKVLADNDQLMEAVKVFVQSKFTVEGNESLSDEVLGQVTRARLTGLRKVEEAFQEIKKFKTIKDNPEQQNPAR